MSAGRENLFHSGEIDWLFIQYKDHLIKDDRILYFNIDSSLWGIGHYLFCAGLEVLVFSPPGMAKHYLHQDTLPLPPPFFVYDLNPTKIIGSLYFDFSGPWTRTTALSL